LGPADKFGKTARIWGAGLLICLAGAAVVAQPSAPPRVPQPLTLGPGVTLTRGELKNPPHGSNIVALDVTVENHGSVTIKLKYADFSLSDGAGERSMALLPVELAYENISSGTFQEGTLASGQRRSGTLYFRTPYDFPRPFNLRIDLETAGNADLSRTFWPL
jgi:uncharacterized protein DUF4352